MVPSPPASVRSFSLPPSSPSAYTGRHSVSHSPSRSPSQSSASSESAQAIINAEDVDSIQNNEEVSDKAERLARVNARLAKELKEKRKSWANITLADMWRDLPDNMQVFNAMRQHLIARHLSKEPLTC